MKNAVQLKASGICMMQFTLLLMLYFSLTVHQTRAAEIYFQDNEIVSGKVVSDENEPLPGVNILVKDRNVGTITDAEGNYTINIPSGASTLIFSFIGFESQEVDIAGRSVVNVTLIPDIEQLQEVVVIGYGTQRKSHLTGAVSKVTNEKLDQIPVSRIDDALVGQVSGVNIQMTNPAAGEAPTIRVRGQGSITFDSNPLIVIDGIAVGTDADFLSSIDMNNVESIEVLKDAASAAIYGSRGANGIIMITTKQGREGPTRFSYNGYTGIKSVPANDVLTTIDEWANFVRANNNGELTEEMEYIQLLGTNTDWQKVMMDGGIIQSHSLSARGGTKNTNFRASVSYLNDEGVLLTDNFEKINFRLNLDTKVNERIEFGVVLNPSHTEQRRFPIGVHDALRQSPWLPLYLDENSIAFVNRFRESGRWADVQIGDYAMERMFDDFDLVNGIPNPAGTGTDISTTSNQTPLAKVLEDDERKYQTKIFANTYVRINLLDNLFFKQSFGGDFRYKRNKNFRGVEATRNGAADSRSTRSTSIQFHTVTESTLNFDKQIGGHSIGAVAGMAYEKWNREYTDVEAVGYDFDYVTTIPAVNSGATEETEESLISYLARVNYAFDDKYLLSVSARTDGSSKFGPDHKFGFFPAVSAGWNIAREAFLSDSKILSDLKLRVSYGTSGSNSGIGEYDHIGLLAPVGVVLGGSRYSGYNPQNIANADLRWEKLVEINPGLDASFMGGRFTLSVDYYQRRSQDLLLNLPVPGVTGFTEALVNKGEVENKGFEVELRTRNYRNANFSWSTSIIASRNENTLIDFVGSSGRISIVDDKRPAEWIALEGHPISSFYGYVVKDEIPLEYIDNPFYPINAQSQDIYVKDLNGDGVIDSDDRTVLGSPYPDVVWSVTNNFTFKGFDLSLMVQGSHGAEVRNIDSQYIKNEFAGKQDYTSDLPNPEFVRERIFTSDDIQDASYVALRNLNIGYSIPASLINKFSLQKARLYVGAQNLLYIMSDDYEGFNPEGINQGLDSPLTYGYQRGPAPIYRTFSVGVNIEF